MWSMSTQISPIPNEIDETDAAATESEVLATIDSERIRLALGSLDAKERQVIVLAYYGGRSYRDVAVALGLPEGTVKSQMRSGLRRLSTILEDDGLGEDR